MLLTAWVIRPRKTRPRFVRTQVPSSKLGGSLTIDVDELVRKIFILVDWFSYVSLIIS